MNVRIPRVKRLDRNENNDLYLQELQKVTWPEKKDTFLSSAIVILLIILFSLFFLLTDQIWSFSIKKIIQIGSGF